MILYIKLSDVFNRIKEVRVSAPANVAQDNVPTPSTSASAELTMGPGPLTIVDETGKVLFVVNNPEAPQNILGKGTG